MKPSTSSCSSDKSRISNKNSSSGSREWTQNETIEFIATWKEEEALYNIRHPVYSIKQEINNDTKQHWFLSLINHQLRIYILLKALVYLRFFNQGLTLTLLFLFVFCFVVFLKNIYSEQIEHLFMINREGFLLHEFHEIQLYAMKYASNCVSWNSLKEIFHSVSSPFINSKLSGSMLVWRNSYRSFE